MNNINLNNKYWFVDQEKLSPDSKAKIKKKTEKYSFFLSRRLAVFIENCCLPDYICMTLILFNPVYNSNHKEHNVGIL